MLKYLHEALGLLHDFLSESQEPGARRLDDRLTADQKVRTDPERRDGRTVRQHRIR